MVLLVAACALPSVVVSEGGDIASEALAQQECHFRRRKNRRPVSSSEIFKLAVSCRYHGFC
jgi:hypothetical protein